MNGYFESIRGKLWFDVEKRYKTMYLREVRGLSELWFDVEKRYKTIVSNFNYFKSMLWFDVEKRYKTISDSKAPINRRCGLM